MKKTLISAFAFAFAVVFGASATDGTWFDGGISDSGWTQTGWTNTSGSEFVTDHVDVDAAYNAPLTYTADAYAIDAATSSLVVDTDVKFTPFKHSEIAGLSTDGKAGVIVANEDGDTGDLHYYVLAKVEGVNSWRTADWYENGVLVDYEPTPDPDISANVKITIFKDAGVTKAIYEIDGLTATVEIDAAADYQFSQVCYAGSGEVSSVLGDRESNAVVSALPDLSAKGVVISQVLDSSSAEVVPVEGQYTFTKGATYTFVFEAAPGYITGSTMQTDVEVTGALTAADFDAISTCVKRTPTIFLIGNINQTLNEGVYTFVAQNSGETIATVYTNGAAAVATGLGTATATWTAPATILEDLNVVVAANVPEQTVTSRPWWDNPVAVATNYGPLAASDDAACSFHSSMQQEFIGNGFSTGNGNFYLFKASDLLAGNATPVYSLDREAEGFIVSRASCRGSAISKALGIVIGGDYDQSVNKSSYVFSMPLDAAPVWAGASQNAWCYKPTNSEDISANNPEGCVAFDAMAFSPDSKYLFTNYNPADVDRQDRVAKWRVINGLKGAKGGLELVGYKALGTRIRHVAFAHINDKDYAFVLLNGTSGIKLVDMTSDDPNSWTADTLVSSLATGASYGMISVSGIAKGSIHLTVAASLNPSTDAIYVYSVNLATPSATLIKSFDHDAIVAMGCGSTVFYRETVLTTDNEETLFYGQSDVTNVVVDEATKKQTHIYAIQYVAPKITVTFKDYDDSVIDSFQIDSGTTPTPPADPTRAGYTFTGWNPAVAQISEDTVYTAQYEAVKYDVTVNQPLEGGTVTTDAMDDKAAAGDTVTVSIKLGGGYTCTGVTYNGNAATKVNDITYTFTMPAANVTVAATFEAEASGTEVIPGETVEVQNEGDAALVTVALDDNQKTLTDDQQAAYKALFDQTVTGTGPYTVGFELKAAVEEEIEADVADGAAELVELVGDEGTVEIDTIPGLYYSISKGTSLDGMVEGPRTMADGDTLELDVGEITGTSGFYQILVNTADNKVED